MANKALPKSIRVIDSHTGGEPTRVIIENGPNLGNGTLVERRERFRNSFDHFRTAVINEPRGSDVIVGAVPVLPHDPSCSIGVIFFNNASYLGMCGHGTIGLMVTLAHLGRVDLGVNWLDTPVGKVKTTLHDPNRVTVENVRSYRFKKNVEITVPDYGRVTGDVAWGGNWFFLVSNHEQAVTWSNLSRLDQFAKSIRDALEAEGIRGANGELIDHIELFGSGDSCQADSQNYVLCPGGAYDRSPCGTGTSAKLACLAADGKLPPGQVYRQASIIGSIFEASYQLDGDGVIPSITGNAYVSGDNLLHFDEQDPFMLGISQ